MARKETQPAESKSIFRYLLLLMAGVVVLVGAIFAFQSAERFLLTDARFRMAAPDEYGEDSPDLRIEGVDRASRVAVRQVFAEDFGRSVYLCPIRKRRVDLLAVPWVKDATVLRIWPNRAVVHIVERKPVAHVPMPSITGDGMTLMMIDEDGVLLEARNGNGLNLPVLNGFRPGESRDLRRARVKKMQTLLTEAAQFAGRFSEIDVTVIENVRVTMPAEGQALTLVLGGKNFGVRLKNFFDNYSEVRRRLPRSKVLDLRLEDRVTGVDGEDEGGASE